MAAVRCEKAAISSKKNIVELQWQDGHRSRFHSCWLRFNCRCDRCKRKIVGERNVKRSDFPDQLEVKKVEINEAKNGLSIWINGDTTKDHVTFMDCDWLREMCYCDQCLYKMIHEKDMKVNDTSIIPRIDYNNLENDECLFRMLEDIFNVGFVVVSNVPCKEGSVAEVGETLGSLVDNTYGKIFNVIDVGKHPDHLSDSSACLPLHTDQCHYEAGPGMQLLHAIRFDECVEGGDSQLVDMFRVMELFRKESPEDFRVLTRVPCTFSTIDYRSDRGAPVHLITRKPIIQVDYDDQGFLSPRIIFNQPPYLIHLIFSQEVFSPIFQIVGFAWNPGIEDILRVHEDDVEPFYRAYKKLQAMAERPELMFHFRLRSGDLVIFNNRRMMHARASYRSNGGVRHLQGCYIGSEDLRSKYVLLGRKLGKIVTAMKIGNGSAI